MLRMSKLTDYAFVIMAYLALHESEAACSATVIAIETQLPAATVRKILKTLAQAKLVISQQGATGGYSLTAKPSQINMAQVINAMELKPSLTVCAGDDNCCQRKGFCHMQPNWSLVNHKLEELFSGITLDEFMAKP